MELKISVDDTTTDLNESGTTDKSTEEIFDIPDDINKCILIKSIFGNVLPATIFFQYNIEANLIKKNITNNYRFITGDDEFKWSNKKYQSYCVLYKAYKNIPDCILLPMKTNGIVRTKSFLQANLIWKLLKIDKMSILIKKLNKYQRYNHFPCTWQLGRKDNLWKNYKIMSIQFPKDYDYLPETFILPENKQEMLKKVSNSNKMWMIKPVASSRGRGIRLMTNIETIPEKCLISRYIDNPHLINNKKYDLRLYVIVTGFSPLKVYLYDEGLARFASEEYNIDNSNIHNRYMHLTNYSVNKCSNRFDKNINTQDECTGSKWSLTALRSHFNANGIDFESTWSKIKDIVIKSVISVTEENIEAISKLTKNKNNLFELYGFDVLIDSDFRPWLIEINLNPSLNCDSELDLKVKSALMSDIFTLVGLAPYSRSLSSEPILLQNLISGNGGTQSGADTPYEQAIYSLDEFSRKGMFHRIFPLKENVDYYSKFISEPGEDNLFLWKFLKDEIKFNLPIQIVYQDVYNV